ncbi:transcriptional regulator, MucR family [Methylobacterium sp. 4-46]|uniref:MucR family transcriptional regulator n=1 Tax=unclassified Methylobacterium TaxID=2615210 RepID=UPI000152D1AB|nr:MULTISPECIES: MucR family transcriptional regulator [Methylobacterium]ACA19870.1 transcriptional regulator, MucR family [Methylobacterium sp. 4-46]WFT79053.1 MucR family transcriptional regulator [Methylobacterium nodulans]
MAEMRENAPETDTVELTAAIIAAYVSKNATPVGDLPGLIASVHDALNQLSAPPAEEPAPLTPLMPIKKTVTPDYIVSLEDGRQYKSLKRHLGTRGLTPDEYRRKWGLPPDYPMVAANYAAKRSELAKASGLGQGRGGKARTAG